MRFYDVTSWSYVNLDDPIQVIVITTVGLANARPNKFNVVLSQPLQLFCDNRVRLHGC